MIWPDESLLQHIWTRVASRSFKLVIINGLFLFYHGRHLYIISQYRQGPSLRKFRNTISPEPKFHGMDMTGEPLEDTICQQLVVALVDCLKERFDTEDPVTANAAKIVNFRSWPIEAAEGIYFLIDWVEKCCGHLRILMNITHTMFRLFMRINVGLTMITFYYSFRFWWCWTCWSGGLVWLLSGRSRCRSKYDRSGVVKP